MPISLRFPITLVLSFVCLTTPAWADFQAGLDAYNHGDYATALREWRPLAERGDAIAQFSLGALYDNGQGVPQDYVQAREWYEKAAAQGHAGAQTGLGTLHLIGHGVPEDYQRAVYWFSLAADQGDSLAQIKLGIAYEEGTGLTKDFVLAHKWYNLAAANGIKSIAHLRDQLEKNDSCPDRRSAEAGAGVEAEWKMSGHD